MFALKYKMQQSFGFKSSKFKVQSCFIKTLRYFLFANSFKNYDILLTKICFILPIFVFARKFGPQKNKINQRE